MELGYMIVSKAIAERYESSNLPLSRSLKWQHSSVGLERRPHKAEGAGSNPAAANFLNNI